ncbi:MAG: hypothetical protein C0406_05860 [Sideroxydans sp.]|nr:hypothetical protein [Sideroxydans sp.]
MGTITIFVAVITAFHMYLSYVRGLTFLSKEFMVLVIILFVANAWEGIQKISIGISGVEISKSAATKASSISRR